MEGGISYNIGSIFGASLFVITIAVGLAIIQTKGKVRLSALVAKRDIVFFIVSTVTIVAIAYYKWITWWNSLFLLFLYGCLIVSVYFSDYIKKRKLVKLKTMALENPTNEAVINKINSLEGNAHDQHYVETPRSVDSSTRKSVAMALGELMLTIGVHLSENQGLDTLESQQLDKQKVEKLADQLDAKLSTIKNFRRKKVTDLSTPEILLRAFDQCFIWILDLTVLPSDVEEYSKTRCIIYPIPGLLFIALYFDPEISLKHILMLVIAGVVISTIFSIVLKEKEPPKWFPVLNVLGIGSALIWTDLLVEILIDMVKFLGVRYNLSNAYMGLTVIAAGRAVPDLVTTLVLCKHCDKLSIVSSVYVAQVFNLVFGFGLAMFRLCLLKGPQPFDLFEESKLFKNAPEIIVIGVTLVVLVATGIHLVRKRHKMRLYFAYGLIWTYVIFFGVVTYIAFVNSFSK